jgi:alkylation response protein AidB-like acyl-CoA dehydrogenase
MTPEARAALDDAVARLQALDLGDEYDPRAPDAIVAAGLHRLIVPIDDGGSGAGLVDAAEALLAIGAVDGSTALGFAMHVHVAGSALAGPGPGWPAAARERLVRAIVDDGSLINAASTEESGGSPSRGAIPGTVAEPQPDGGWRLTGEKTWTTWLPALQLALISARLDGEDPPVVGLFLVELGSPGIDRSPGFEALGMRGSASGRLRLDGVKVPAEALVLRRLATAPDPRGPGPGAWFGAALAAAYLGVGEGARREVARYALDRRPGDGSTSVADVPSVQVRLGRLDATLRAARIVVLDVARRWDEAVAAGDAAAMAAAASDMPLAKLVATQAAVIATDEAMRIAGGPGFLAGRLERALRDARAGLINPPLEDVTYQAFARVVLGREGRAEPGP